MAKYYITGIKVETLNGHTFISKALIHEVIEGKVKPGTVKSKDEIIKLIKTNGNSVLAALWNYSTMQWNGKEEVSYETINKIEYLRSTPDESKRDNLLHLLPLANLGL